MGPLLFGLCINDLPSQFSDNVDKNLYADAFQFIIHGAIDNIDDMIKKANEELVLISNWFSRRKLKLNAQKSTAMILSSNDINVSNELPKILLDDKEIEIVDCVKNLGLFMDNRLSFERHVNEMMKKVYFSLHSLRINKLYLETDIKLKLVHALVIPHFLYCDVIIAFVNSRLRNKITKAFKCVIRFCYGLKKRDTTRNFSKSIFGCEIFDYFNYRFVLFLFKIIHYKEPSYLYEKLIFSKSERTCNLILPKYTNTQKNRFVIKSAQIWNELPNEIKRESNFVEFKKLSFNHFSNK